MTNMALNLETLSYEMLVNMSFFLGGVEALHLKKHPGLAPSANLMQGVVGGFKYRARVWLFLFRGVLLCGCA